MSLVSVASVAKGAPPPVWAAVRSLTHRSGHVGRKCSCVPPESAGREQTLVCFRTRSNCGALASCVCFSRSPPSAAGRGVVFGQCMVEY